MSFLEWGARILHVDDSRTAREAVGALLRAEGFEVLEAESGEEALHVALSARPDLVVLDVSLPDIDGFEVCRRILAEPRTAAIPVLHLSETFSRPADRVRGLQNGAAWYLTQPVEPSELVATARTLVRMRVAERRAVELGARWQAAHDAVQEGVCLLDRDGRVVQSNRAFKVLAGSAPDGGEPTRPIREVLGFVDLDCVAKLLAGSEHVECEVQTGDRWLAVHGDAVSDGELAAVLTFRDVTESRRVQEALHRSEERFRALVQNSADVIALVDAGGRLQYLSPAAVRLFGSSPADRIGHSIFERVHPDDLEAAEATFAEVRAAPGADAHTECRVGTAQGGWRTVEIVASNRLDDPAIGGIVANLRDITERKEAEEALGRSEKRFRALVQNSTDIIELVDADLRLQYVNPAAQRLFGRAPTDRIGRSILEHVHPEDLERAAAALVEARAAPSADVRTDCRVDTEDGEWRTVEVVATNHLDDPSIAGIVINLRDVTERRRAEEALRNTNQALRTLSAGNECLVRATDEAALLADMCRVVVEVGGYRLAWIGAADPDAPGQLRPICSHGHDEGLHDAVRAASASEARGPLSDAIRSGRPYVVDDFAALPESVPYRRSALDRGARSLIALPLTIAGDQAFGTLVISSARPGAFDDDAVRLLGELARDLAFGITALRTRAERQDYLERLGDSLEAVTRAIATTVELRDPYTAGHAQRVAELSVAIAVEMGLDPDAVKGIEMAATIHDIGKIGIPAEILSKPGRLSAAQFELIRGHSQAGYDIVAGIEFPWPVPEMILQHHERLDGSGYPAGLRGDDIIPGARILAVADVVEAMVSHRPYRPALGVGPAMVEIDEHRGTRFDPVVVDACLRLFREKRFRFRR